MKKITILLVVVLLGIAGYFFLTNKPAQNQAPTPVTTNNPPASQSASSQTKIDTNDNLDQALIDLEQTD